MRHKKKSGKRISDLRRRLDYAVDYENLHSEHILKISRKLDLMIAEYYLQGREFPKKAASNI